MYRIINKPKSPKMVWDAKKGEPLLTFKGGSFNTEDKTIAEKAKSLGFEVVEETEPETEDKPKKARKTAKAGE